MEDLKQLLENIEKVEITYDYEDTYSNLYNLIIDYSNNTQDFELLEIVDEENFINYEELEERAKYELEENGLERLQYFLPECLIYDLYKINGYGNCENIYLQDLQDLKDLIIDEIKIRMKEGE